MYRLTTPLLDTWEIARLLRVKVSTIRKWTCYKKIPVVRIGRRVLFHRATVEDWLKKQNE